MGLMETHNMLDFFIIKSDPGAGGFAAFHLTIPKPSQKGGEFVESKIPGFSQESPQ